MKRTIIALFFGLSLLGVSSAAQTAEKTYKNTPLGDIQTDTSRAIFSTNMYGLIGLNTIPTARQDKKGTIRAGLSTSDPYLNAFLGFQVSDNFYMSFRQTAELSSLTQNPDFYRPALDLKYNILDERRTRPALSVGMDAAFGDKRTSSEYLVLSKRLGNFDLTGGLGWGRLGGEGHFKNPLIAISDHFDKDRTFNSFLSQDTEDWFTGEEVGLFGGLEYFTKINGLSLKLDYNAKDYAPEEFTIDGFEAPAPWSASLNYKAWQPLDLSLGIIGGQKIMARVSLQDNAANWPLSHSNTDIEPFEKTPYRVIDETVLDLHSFYPAPWQIGSAAKRISAQNKPEKISFNLSHKGLVGPSVTLVRNDIQTKNKTAEEIWRNARVEKSKTGNLLSPRDLTLEKLKKRQYRFFLDGKTSLSEPDTGTLYRVSALVEATQQLPYGFMFGTRARLNIADNLDRLRKTRFSFAPPIRADEPDFADQRVALDTLHASWLRSLTPSTHIGLTAGYLEEMFAGAGGEILHRPFGKTFAIGAEAWRVNKRDPFSTLNKTLLTDTRYTGHVKLYYELPQQRTTFSLSGGKYLNQDIGGSIDIETTFKNNTTLKAFATVTDQKGFFIFEDQTHLHGGVQLSIPFGSLPFVPAGSEARLSSGPFARDNGQTLNKPVSLYEVTEPLSKRALIHDWHSLKP